MQRSNRTYRMLALGAVLALAAGASAQSGKKYIRKGNDLYQKQQYTDAEANYKKALQQNQQSDVGHYNLGNSLYGQKKFDAARTQYANSAKISGDKTTKSDANYNIGNTYMEGKKWEESIKSYKQALKMNPADEEARYNLAYAQAMLKKQQQGSGGDNKDKQEKKKQEQNKDQNKDKQNKQDQQQDKDKEEQDQNKPQSQPSKLDKEEAERLLQALNQEEKKLQDKLKKAKGQQVPVEKDW
ncbi:MAG TPA: tetratricopeptide repeat protein [Chitinophaga sp.]